MTGSTSSPWWPHPSLRTGAYWRGRARLYRVVAEATLEFVDRVEVYELNEQDHQAYHDLAYQDRIAFLLRRRPDRVEYKLPTAAPPPR
ncbi:MAG: hypothetical protein NZ518_05245 [Dehalococcoidia bacterium]|nr:hypothetical protein [Dehalococcoidia bacterium]